MIGLLLSRVVNADLFIEILGSWFRKRLLLLLRLLGKDAGIALRVPSHLSCIYVLVSILSHGLQ